MAQALRPVDDEKRPTIGRVRALVPLLLGVGYFLAASAGIELTRHAGGIAAFWPPNALMLAALLGWPSVARIPTFLSCLAGNIVANMAYGDSMAVALGFASTNLLEVLIPLGLVHWQGCRGGYLSNLKNASLLALGALGGVVMASPIGAGIVTLAYDASWTRVLITWLAADLAGMLIFVPALLSLAPSERHHSPSIGSSRSTIEIALVSCVIIMVFTIVFVAQHYAMPYLLIPVVLWLATRFSLAATANTCALIAVTAVVTTIVAQSDIFGLSDRSVGQQIIDLQIFIAIVTVSALPLAVLSSERTRLVGKLRASEQRYALVLEASGAGIWAWDADTDELTWSNRLMEMVGVNDASFRPDISSFMDRLHPDDRDRVQERRRLHLEAHEPYDIECRLRRVDGSYIWIHNRGRAEWDEMGRPVHMTGSAEDITARKAAEIQNALYAAELERSNRELEDFAYIASHDLKEPLRAAYNHAAFCLEDHGDQLEEGGKQRLQRIMELSQRMQQLISDLHHFARLGRIDEGCEVVSLHAVLDDIEANLAERLEEQNAAIVIATPLPEVRGHRPQVMALFQNLISNGIKYNDSASKVIEIGVTMDKEADDEPDGFVTLHVSDNGIGIEPRFHDDVFRLFKRLNSEKAYGAGTGAGLAFAKKIVEGLGGNISLTSTPGKGTTFRLSLPVVQIQTLTGNQAA